MICRRATHADLDSVVGMDAVAWDANSTPSQLPLSGAWARDVDLRDLLVAEVEGRVVGYALVGPRIPDLDTASHAGSLRSMAVHPDARRQGVGSALLHATLEEGRARGWTTVTLHALATNKGAIALYRSAGFQVVGRVSDHFRIDGAAVDDLLLQCVLSEEPREEWLAGGCHCGAVRFRVRVTRWQVLDCNCSICSKKGILHLIVGPDDFELVEGRDHLRTYRFGTNVAQHHFCRRCGMHPFYRPRSHPEGWDVNARCLDGDAKRRFRVLPFDGRHWELNVDSIR